MSCSDLPPGFYRAEAAWLSPPDDCDDVPSLIEDLFEIKTEILDILYSFEEVFCGMSPEDLRPEAVYRAAQLLVRDIGECLSEWDRVEEEIQRRSMG
ncbi:MAG: hypothetical protein BWY45_01018 [Euryarchaeota archaeon ADurb.Bin294]|jgi:hypothetical protein|nr:hypothetical protein [Methanospirillum sp.]OQA58861.1 MAG: hypothetical protein BWY45_01018 [Euryarchaeota archaeon ADurb.Bin294]